MGRVKSFPGIEIQEEFKIMILGKVEIKRTKAGSEGLNLKTNS